MEFPELDRFLVSAPAARLSGERLVPPAEYVERWLEREDRLGEAERGDAPATARSFRPTVTSSSTTPASTASATPTTTTMGGRSGTDNGLLEFGVFLHPLIHIVADVRIRALIPPAARTRLIVPPEKELTGDSLLLSRARERQSGVQRSSGDALGTKW